MKQTIVFWVWLLLGAGTAQAQDFITRGKIEYEIRRNIKRMWAEDNEPNNSFSMAMPEFDVSYRELIFSWNRWVYQPGRPPSTASRFINENVAYVDLDKKERVTKQQFLDDYRVFEDSLLPIKWKIENETRKIAGWECRKAVGRIQDSVYVVAFYCPEIIPQGGPEFFSGLPGMILGLAIPRFYTTWFATRVEIANVDESKIVPPSLKKSKQYAKKELAEILLKQYKDAGWWPDVTLEKVIEEMGHYTF